MNDYLMHYGTPRHSGRYPYGSGKDPYQSNKSFLGYVNDLKKQGLTEVEIAKGLGMTTTQLRAKKSIATNEVRQADAAMAYRLKEKGLSNVAIGERMGINESTVRSLLNPALDHRAKVTESTANILKKNVDEKDYIDIGPGSEIYLGVSRTKLKTAVALLEEQGYEKHLIQVGQMNNPDQKTTISVLTKAGTPTTDIYANRDKISIINAYSNDGGETYTSIKKPTFVSSDRVKVRYNEEGGVDKDGVIELRRGVDDLSLGSSRYAQVRISVDGTHYLKGMAMYSDDMPPGTDIIFNTNKHKGTPKMDCFKKMKDDPDNPFGAVVRQKNYIDKDGNKKLSPVNIVREEGEWSEWSKTISSQMLSKQPVSLAKKQLGLAYAQKKDEYDEICSLTNPAVRKRLLKSFADDCDASAVHLDAAALPRQGYHVILPFPGMKENEIYAPNYRNGESVVLIRYPHGGTFEIPELKVNNKFPGAEKTIKNARDAVGINSKVAERLSGADFDGDTVLVIPNNKGAVKTSKSLAGLKDFEPKEAYPGYPGMKKMTSSQKQQLMGDVSNLITDMTIKGADTNEICRAVRHSMVVIDAEKHGLNYKQSYIDNGIADLKQKYQGGKNRGASTLISKASSEKRVPHRKEITNPSLMTKEEKERYNSGKKVYRNTGETYTKYVRDESGKVTKKVVVNKTTKTTKMAEADDAYSLSSGTLMESIYANHANKLKSLASTARKEYLATPNAKYSPSAKKTYAPEVKSLNSKLLLAQKNAPLERKAQLVANTMLSAKKKDNVLTKEEAKKEGSKCLAIARTRLGAGKQRIDITDKEWEAIQAGAISNNTLNQILSNTDLDKIKTLATPRQSSSLSSSKIVKAKAMLDSGYTQSEVAESLGVSVTTLHNNL